MIAAIRRCMPDHPASSVQVHDDITPAPTSSADGLRIDLAPSNFLIADRLQAALHKHSFEHDMHLKRSNKALFVA
jgi:hypothetical protein